MKARPSKRGREVRSFGSFLDLRASRDGAGTLIGHAAVFNSMSKDLGGFREVIKPGAFRRAISDRQDVRALWNHDPNCVLGRTTSGTLRLSEDKIGLHVEVNLPTTTLAGDLSELIGRGDISEMSFAFRAVKDEWTDQVLDGKRTIVRELIDVDLFDVSAVTYPAYENTQCTIRRAKLFNLELEIFPERSRIRQLKNEIRTLELHRLFLQNGGLKNGRNC